MEKTVKMIFGEDKFVNGEIFASKGEIVEVPEASVTRWLKRGGAIVEEMPTPKAQKHSQVVAPETKSEESVIVPAEQVLSDVETLASAKTEQEEAQAEDKKKSGKKSKGQR